MSRTISLLEFRHNAKRTLDAVRRGERLVLTYRGHPVARLEPVHPAADAVSDDEPFLRIEEVAVDGPGGRLANRDIDRLVGRHRPARYRRHRVRPRRAGTHPVWPVRPHESGTIGSLTVRIGDTVAEGQILATLDPFEHRQTLADLEARLRQRRLEHDKAVAVQAIELARQRDRVAAADAAITQARAALRAELVSQGLPPNVDSMLVAYLLNPVWPSTWRSPEYASPRQSIAVSWPSSTPSSSPTWTASGNGRSWIHSPARSPLNGSGSTGSTSPLQRGASY